MTIESIIPEIHDTPGTHVLVIGVSDYLHFEGGKEPTKEGKSLQMEQLSAAARSASEFAAWMLNEYNHSGSKLSSLRILLSPSPEEEIHPDIKSRLNDDYSATIANTRSAIKSFREICDKHSENTVVVYVAGHGVQLTKSGSILLLNDCGSNEHLRILEGALDMAGIHASFNHPGTAQKQFWFVDACRQKPSIARRFEDMDGALKLDVPDGIAECSPMFLAATTGTEAYARIGGMTLFSESLLWSLRGNNASPPEDNFSDAWHVSVQGLVKRLGFHVKALAEAENAEQTVDPTGRLNDAVFHEYPEVPDVDLQIDLIPDAANNKSKCSLRSDSYVLINEQVNWPITSKVDAGLYEIQVVSPADFKSFNKFVSLMPPSANPKIDVTPS